MSANDQTATPEVEDWSTLNEPTVDFFILADYAEAVNGKLYMMGGGWDRIFVADFDQPVVISFAVSVLVPWNATNIRHAIELAIEDIDRKRPVDFGVSASFVTGRPPFISEGERQRTLLAIPGALVKFPGPGPYQAVAKIVGGQERRVEFRLVPAATVQMPAQRGNA
jgi:hypothetical protein